MTASKFERLHPGLPTRSEVQQNPELFYSDHIPQLMRVPLGQGDASLKILSYNVCYPNLPSGYDPLPREYDHNARSSRIAEAVRACVVKQDVDIIVLQEMTEEQRDKIAARLGEDWVVSSYPEDNVNNGLISCYRKDRFELQGVMSDGTPQRKNERTHTFDFMQILKLKRIGSQEPPMALVNFHGNPSPEESNKDHVFKTLFTSDAHVGLHVMAGDFNIPMGNMNGQKGVTGLVPPMFNYGYIKGHSDEDQAFDRRFEVPNSTDGGLFKFTHGDVVKCQPQALDVHTGELINDANLNQDSDWGYELETAPVYEPKEFLRFTIIQRLEEAKNKLEESHWYLHVDKAINTSKKFVLQQLINEIQHAPPGSDYKKIIETWEKTKTDLTDKAGNTKSYRDIIHHHRNIFFSSSKGNTRTEDTLDDLKTDLSKGLR